ncbi:EAL domain-containing response regulator [Thioflexithrix psekupsensis]|uniref:GGDEF domain-containing response regulator n=1 Tax=Thioflexithrix psekupsensis TaxID=1570016 RepID=A0A251X9S0_9GAMM|nr:GGDEF domain-containing response regulator [Thioflexithrix psekupsensis]OUD15000.1 hypothetical protein TPSD3_04675 [Thioflexithrix psekupsensis]
MLTSTARPPVRKNILIVDDNPDNLRLLSAMLTKQGYKVRSVISGAMALIGVRAAPPDLILLDINMPEMDGFSLCQQLKADPNTSLIPVIFISALDEVLDKVQAFAVGGVDYITKPFQWPEVLARVENQLRLQELQQALSTLNAELEQRVRERTAALQAEIEQRQQTQLRLEYLVKHDSLTELPNRTLLMEYLTSALDTIHQDNCKKFAVLFLDCDRFKLVNDSFGHLLGDQLLLAIAKRLQNVCEQRVALLSRLGGDEFTILMLDVVDIAPVLALAEELRRAFVLPFTLANHEIFITVSIGIALIDSSYYDPVFILRDADTAMYRAKTAHSQRGYCVFDASMHTAAHNRLLLESDLRRALEREEFHLLYQPIFSLITGQLAGFEALLRWQHPERGLLSPLDFVGVCEETGLILPVGEWVLQQACQQLQRWCQLSSAAQQLTLSVNVSTRQFSQTTQLLSTIASILQAFDLRPGQLKLEITESAIMDNLNSAEQLLKALRAYKLSISLDDFGTGYSSLSYLHQFAIDELKIDRAFTARLDAADSSRTIVSAIIALAQALSLTVVAEGIETVSQRQWLSANGCQLGQGYGLSYPLDATQALELIQKTTTSRFS